VRITKKILVKGPLGLHLRAAAEMVSIVNKFHSKVTVRKEGRQASGRSLLNLMALGAVKGTELEIELEGGDAQAALNVIEDFFGSGFHEKAPKSLGTTGLEIAGFE